MACLHSKEKVAITDCWGKTAVQKHFMQRSSPFVFVSAEAAKPRETSHLDACTPLNTVLAISANLRLISSLVPSNYLKLTRHLSTAMHWRHLVLPSPQNVSEQNLLGLGKDELEMSMDMKEQSLMPPRGPRLHYRYPRNEDLQARMNHEARAYSGMWESTFHGAVL